MSWWGLDRDAAALSRVDATLAGRCVGWSAMSAVARHSRARDGAAALTPLTVWVNNAGIETPTRAATLDDDGPRAMIDVNLIGTLLGCSTAAASLQGSGGGSIVNTRQLAIEESSGSIRCTSARPGAVHTPLTQSVLDVRTSRRPRVVSMQRCTPSPG